ncbi:peptide chain release factor N(5)-glutamine methyltransferase [Acidaminococcus fermentans]|uniref:peptide chain release factor N(5)-glutamine methyltransferase n=1 Tax=Acidaminococcus fermentans TaxID=905 RepID=UPI00242E9B43|nr:peptide chain release factor N(5)-glutamine methyltransferase [Acidaminococcus fermentans]MCI6286978.1 peptide chain release factor N(5)-glutamine methyltransferase [Acidaminococcus fermentans]MDY2853323.1 peptide chain release factor N(5)-glutamine methyltransferase [Acidaminococcus fermentans]
MQEQKTVWTILKILQWTQQYFQSKGVENPRLDAEVLLCAVLDKSRIQLYTNFDEPLEEQELKQYRGYVARRAAREPVAYILGHKGFLQYDFKVTKDTLIPRPETELLVEQLVSLNRDRGPVRILDLGCGSGAIIDSLLAELPEARGMGVDISPGAAAVTRENALSLGVGERLETVVSDLYEKVPREEKFQVLVSNPPYIPEGDLAGLQAEVHLEPRRALDGGRDGLDFYRRILRDLWSYLDPEGMAAFEIGQGQGEDVARLCREAGLDCVKVRKDYGDMDRMVFAAKGGTVYGNAILEIKGR